MEHTISIEAFEKLRDYYSFQKEKQFARIATDR